MKTVYEPLSADGFELCHPVRQEDFETFIGQIDGTPRRTNWQPIAVRLVKRNEGQQ